MSAPSCRHSNKVTGTNISCVSRSADSRQSWRVWWRISGDPPPAAEERRGRTGGHTNCQTRRGLPARPARLGGRGRNPLFAAASVFTLATTRPSTAAGEASGRRCTSSGRPTLLAARSTARTRSLVCRREGRNSKEAAKALGEETIVAFLVDAPKH